MIAGIDGGGTSTRLELRDGENRMIRRTAYGPFNVSAVGTDGVRAVIREIAGDTDLSAISRFCVGGAGVSFEGLETLLLEEMGRYGFRGKLLVCSDFEIALRGAMNEPGGILIAGTGSVAFGINERGMKARVGGWGHLIDDEGSGYAIGRDALAAAVRTEDGRADAGRLRAEILRAVNGRDNRDILHYVYYSGRDKSSVASLASSVLRLAEDGDENSLRILQKGARELTGIVRALASRLEMKRPRIALLGGLLANETKYGKLVREELHAVCQPTEAEHDALWGAAQLAQEMPEPS